MSTLRIAAGAERVDRERANRGRKLNHADVSATSHAVTTLLSAAGRGVKREDGAVVTIHTTHRETWLRVLKILVFAFVGTLQSRELTPRNFPRAKITLE